MAGWQLPRRPVAVAERRHWSGCDQVTLQGRSPSPRHGLFQGCLVFFRRWALVPASRFCRVVFLPQRARANVCARPALSRAADNHAPPTPAWRYRRVARSPTAPAGTSIGTPAREPGCRHNMMEGGGGRGGGGGRRMSWEGLAPRGTTEGAPLGPTPRLASRCRPGGTPTSGVSGGAVVTLPDTGRWVEVPGPVGLALHQTWGCGEGVALEATSHGVSRAPHLDGPCVNHCMMRFRPLGGARVVGSVGGRPRPRAPAGLPAKGPCAGPRAAEGVGGRRPQRWYGRKRGARCHQAMLGGAFGVVSTPHPPPHPFPRKQASVPEDDTPSIRTARSADRPCRPAAPQRPAAARGGPWRDGPPPMSSAPK